MFLLIRKSQSRTDAQRNYNSPLFEIARILVCLDHGAGFVKHADERSGLSQSSTRARRWTGRFLANRGKAGRLREEKGLFLRARVPKSYPRRNFAQCGSSGFTKL
jgi:hypothetical protein